MKSRQILDPVHGYIDVPAGLDLVLDSPPVQRLRRVSQTALVSTVYPAANGTRFEHALGAMHLARNAALSAWRNSELSVRQSLSSAIDLTIPGYLGLRDEEQAHRIADAVAAVGLLHDIGHPPFSHALEEYFRRNAEMIFADSPNFRDLLKKGQARPFHEIAGEAIVESLAEYFPSRPAYDLFRTIYMADPEQTGWAGTLHAIIASTIDIDRLDYIMRDGLHAGTEYGSVDWRRLISAMQFRLGERDEIRLSLGIRARSAAELLLVQRMQAFRWMYQHPRVVAAEALLRGSLQLVEEMREDGPGEFPQHAVASLTPPLNYVQKSSTYRISGLSVSRLASTPNLNVEASDLQLELPFEVIPENHVADPAQSIFSEIQASVTDDAIVRFCSSLAVCFRHAQSQNHTDYRPQRFLHMYDASLRRSSALVVLWKRHEEFADVASALQASPPFLAFADTFREQHREFVDRMGEANETGGNGHRRVQMLLEDPVMLLNYVGYRLLYRMEKDLGAWLTDEHPEVAGHGGFWYCTFFARRDPLRAIQHSVQLEGGSATRVSLRDSSPLVASIDDVEDRSAKLHAFFVITKHGRSTGIERSELRRRLRETFKTSLPVFLRQHMMEDSVGVKASLAALYKVIDREQDGG